MARPIRIEYEGAFYHVTARGNDRSKIFFTKTDYRKFNDYLAAARKKYGFILHGYVLMTNHYHLLIETPEPNLGKIMHHLNGSYTTYINIKRKRSGHLLQGRYKAILVDKDSYALELSRYLHLNPVRAKMVARPEDYPYSSYGAYVSSGADELVTATDLLSMFSDDLPVARQKYREFVECGLNAELENPQANVYAGMILGSVPFIKESLNRIEEELCRKDESSYKKSLQSTHISDDILALVCTHEQVARKDVTSRQRNDLCKICIYLLKQYTAASNREIGAMLGEMSGFAVAKAYQRIVKEMETESTLREKVKRLEREMSCVKG